MDLLPDRTAESVAAWLTVHPTIQIVARDRSGIYADRFHLIANLSAAVERVLEGRTRELILPAAAGPPTTEPVPSLPVDGEPTTPQLPKQQRRQRRLDRYQQVAELRRQGYSKMAISRELSLSVKTVRRSWLPRIPSDGRRLRCPMASFWRPAAERSGATTSGSQVRRDSGQQAPGQVEARTNYGY